METNKQAGSRRAGKPKRKKAVLGSQALLAALWDKFGGPDSVAKKVTAYTTYDVNRQSPINWRQRGAVPPNLVMAVAQALGINPAGLNYGLLVRVSEKPPSWNDVVRSYDLPKETVEQILFLKPPHLIKAGN